MNLESLRSAPEHSLAVPPPKRRWMLRTGLPLLVILLTGSLFAYATKESLVPRRHVEVIRAIGKMTAVKASEGIQTNHATFIAQKDKTEVSVQAPGWLEPDPFPTYVSALADGVVEAVLVLEGDHVKKGQVLARLNEEDARLALKQAKAELDIQLAHQKSAETNWDHPIELNRQVAVTEAKVKAIEAQLRQLDASLREAAAKEAELKAHYDSLKGLGDGAVSKLDIEVAMQKHASQKARAETVKAQRPILEANRLQMKAEADAAKANLRLRVEEREALEAKKAQVAAAKTRLEAAALRLSRMQIVSPVNGIVMTRLVSTGDKIMLSMDSPHSAHVVHLYDPKRLQVRVDVPLSEAAKVGVGQKAWVTVDVLPDQSFEGEVTRLVHQADISKNTVEVKVALSNPVVILKPDMLARVKFLKYAPSGKTQQKNNDAMLNHDLHVFIADTAIRFENDQAYVWRVKVKDQMLTKIPVSVGTHLENGWRIVNGIYPGDMIVMNPPGDLKVGERVAVTEDSQTERGGEK